MAIPAGEKQQEVIKGEGQCRPKVTTEEHLFLMLMLPKISLLPQQKWRQIKDAVLEGQPQKHLSTLFRGHAERECKNSAREGS